MDMVEQLQALAVKVPKIRGSLLTEEAAKTALVLPFIRALGYDYMDPLEVVPEFHADVPGIKGERVDYAIVQDGTPTIMFECKGVNEVWGDPTHSQLFRYFTSTPVRVGVLTNGILYEFYSDLDAPNRMDRKPFMVVDLTNLGVAPLAELRKMEKGRYNEDEVVSLASEMKYNREMRRFLVDQFREPGEEFSRLLISHVRSGKSLTQKAREEFMPIVRKALQMFVSDQVNDRLRAALAKEGEDPQPVSVATSAVPDAVAAANAEVQTTVEEMEAFYIVKAIAREVIDPGRVVMRDQASYCTIIVDDNNRRPLCRLLFGATKKQLVLFDQLDGAGKVVDSKVQLERLDDMYKFGDRIRATAQRYVPVAK